MNEKEVNIDISYLPKKYQKIVIDIIKVISFNLGCREVNIYEKEN